MRTLDRYLLREFVQASFAALVILLMVSVGGLFTNVLNSIANGRTPTTLIASQLGLQLIRYLPLLLPLALLLGLTLAVGRLYRDAEMPVLTSIGISPKRLLRPLLLFVLPIVLVVGLFSLWVSPWAHRTSRAMLAAGNRSMLVSGLQPGVFTEMPGGGGIIYIGSMSDDGRNMRRVFVYRQKNDRIDVTTASAGQLSLVGDGQRYLRLDDGFRVEGPRGDGMDFRMMRYRSNDVRMPDSETRFDPGDPQMMTTAALLADGRREAVAQLHYRIGPPLLALALALLAVPLARSPPRQARYGRILFGLLTYLVATNLLMLGTDWIDAGKTPAALGLWWFLLPLLLLSGWMYFRVGQLPRARGVRR